MEVGEFYKYLSRYIKLTTFIIAVNSLAAGQNIAHLFLCQILVFAKISYPFVKY